MKNPWSLLWLTIPASGLAFLDNTIMPVALPALQQDLLFSKTGLMWVVNAYLLTLMAGMLIGGRLCDLMGMRRAFSWGFFLFGLGSVLGGIGLHKEWVIFGRILQGMGGAICVPTTGALIMAHFPEGIRAKALGINTGISSLFLILGPLVGGLLTQFFSWKWIFWVQVPIIGFAWMQSQKRLPKEEIKKEDLHLSTASLLVIGIVSIVMYLMQGAAWGWFSWKALALLFLTLSSFLLFQSVSKNSRHSVIDFSIFKTRTFLEAAICIFITQVLIMATVLWAVYFQVELGFSAIKAGTMILIAVTPVLFISPIAGVLADRLNARLPILVGFLILIISLTWFIFVPKPTSIAQMLPALLLFGSGIPLIVTPAFATALSNVPPQNLGSVSALTSSIRQFASTVGIALMTGIFYESMRLNESYVKAFSYVSLAALFLSLMGFLFTVFFMESKKLLSH